MINEEGTTSSRHRNAPSDSDSDTDEKHDLIKNMILNTNNESSTSKATSASAVLRKSNPVFDSTRASSKVK